VPHGEQGGAVARPSHHVFRNPRGNDGERGSVHPRLSRRTVAMKRSSFITWEQLKVGALMLVALIVIGVAIYKLGQSANLFAKRYELITYLPNANGLRPGGSVLVAGQFAGTIKSIDFLPVDN